MSLTTSASEQERQYPLPELPTIIVVHRKERRSKCTVNPLREKPEFQFWPYPLTDRPNVEGYVRLGLGGPLISPADCDSGLLILDGTWRWAERMEADFDDVPVRSLPHWQTAYPRVSKIHDDPAQGLATIEALFAAYHHMGYNTQGLLDSYYWKESFLEKNAELLKTT